VQTPRFCGFACSAGLAVLYFTAWRPLRTNWLIVGILSLLPSHLKIQKAKVIVYLTLAESISGS
jgi:hypothetical protein